MRSRVVAHEDRGVSQMARYARLDTDAHGKVSNAVESRNQNTGRGAVVESDSDLEKVHELRNRQVVVTACRCNLV
jgi:hypothetical protein